MQRRKRGLVEDDGGGGGDEERNKRPRMIEKAPPMVSQFLSANESAKPQEKALALIRAHRTEELALFFRGRQPTNDDLSQYEVSKKVMNQIQANGPLADENKLRNSVFTELHNHDVKFVNSAKSTGKFVTLRKAWFRNMVYNETELSSIFSEFEEDTLQLQDREITKMDRMMHGLPVTTTSKPDMSAVVSDDSIKGKVLSADGAVAAIKISKQLMFGEFKNRKIYTLVNSVHQCTLYLYALLFWLRSKGGIDVEAVYGFTFCGRKCGDHDSFYSVSFVKVSTPMTLNNPIKVQHWSGSWDVKNPRGVQYLVHYLREGSRWELGRARRAPICSTLLSTFWTLPRRRWFDDGSEERTLIKNGTMAIIFKCYETGTANSPRSRTWLL